MSRSPLHTLRARPWARNASLLAQAVHEHIVDDPVLLVLQGARRLPSPLAQRLGGVLAALPSTSIPRVIGLEMLGHRADAMAALTGAAGEARAAGVHRADAATGLGEPVMARDLLERIPAARRGAGWSAAAARVDAFEGRLTEAVAHAGAHRRNRRLAQRLRGELDAFAGFTPQLSRVPDYVPQPGRVVHVLTNSLPHTGSGYAQRSHSILLSLRDQGFDVSAITRPGYPVHIGVPWAAQDDDVDGIRYHRLLPARLAAGQAQRLQQHAELLLDHVLHQRPALLHTTTHFVNAVAVDAVARAVGIPWVYEVRGQLADTWAATHGEHASVSERYRLFVERERQAVADADAVVTLGEQMRESLAGPDVPAERIVLSPNAIGEAFEESPVAAAQARRDLGWTLDSDAVVVGTVSSLVDYEGLDTLLRAAALVRAELPQLRLHIAGDGVARPGLIALARELGLEDITSFPGRVSRDQARLHHAALDVFVVPRRDLPVTRTVTPMKSVEASASARPVIASDLPALAELVDPGITGLLAPAGDPGAWAAALLELAGDPERRARMGAAGRAWALATRTWRGNALRYRALYQSLGVSPR
ncbi:MAG: glycosyltransferase family 4 protein [Micrococcus sp.]|nr:glycosyltransferase family 4 protein [Micrococcus sp.]